MWLAGYLENDGQGMFAMTSTYPLSAFTEEVPLISDNAVALTTSDSKSKLVYMMITIHVQNIIGQALFARLAGVAHTLLRGYSHAKSYEVRSTLRN